MKNRLDFITTPAIGLSYLLTPLNAKNGFFFADDKVSIIEEATNVAQKVEPGFADKIVDQLILYTDEISCLPDDSVIFRMKSAQYWNITGKNKYPELGKFALPFASMIASSAISERTWSTFNFVHSRLRNRLTNERVMKIVFIYTNCTLLDTKDITDYIMDEGAILTGNECE